VAKTLTARAKQVLVAIVTHIEERGFPPTVREICEKVGLASSSTVQEHIRTLRRVGAIESDTTKPRAVTVTAYGQSVAAGMLGRPLRGLLEAVAPRNAYDEESALQGQVLGTIDGIFGNPAVVERAVMRVREKERWMSESGAQSVVAAVLGAVRECLA
jgi:SOS-response transcriptional repressor LexA